MSYNVNNNINNIITNGVNSRVIPHGYFLLSEMESECNYSQEYLSLLARKGELKAKKFGRNWYTTKEWLEEYIKDHALQPKTAEAEKEEKNKTEIISDEEFSQNAKKAITEKGEGQETKKKVAVTEIKAVQGWEKFWQGLIAQIKKTSFYQIVKNNKRQNKILGVSKEKAVEEGKLLTKQIELQKTIEELEKRVKENVIGVQEQELGNVLEQEILDAKDEQARSEAEEAEVDWGEWLKNIGREKLSKAFFTVRLAVAETWRAPKVALKNWQGLSFEYKFRGAAYGLAIVLFLIISGVSMADHELANESYEKVALFTEEKTIAIYNTWRTAGSGWQIKQERLIARAGRALDAELTKVGDLGINGRAKNYFQRTETEVKTNRDKALAVVGSGIDQRLAEVADLAAGIGQGKAEINFEM
ncbi:MAG TPA: hypothetical protein P5267_00670, partial [Patescibacteria group bacterium]|nr:hypothetical protein [Patescibacteria group bacterium]